ncbi:glycerol-3-phosphate acyltransferase [Pelagibacteraceae bacterium]|nr:glycerol-3-phosphate acyltransferase [Pelagibacteraceae bacterium]
MSLEILYLAFYSYFLGSIPFGLIITKFFLNKDLREVGSGNIGATNVLRTGKKFLSACTLLLDGLKAYISVTITYKYFPDYVYLSALLCFLGHIFPIWLKFKGGKGIAVFLGVLFALSINFGIAFCFLLVFNFIYNKVFFHFFDNVSSYNFSIFNLFKKFF